MPEKRNMDLEAAVEALVGQGNATTPRRRPLLVDEPSVELPLPGPSPWLVTARFVVRDGRPVIRDLHIVASHGRRRRATDIPPEGLTTTHLRQIRMPRSIEANTLEALLQEAGVPIVTEVEARTSKTEKAYSDDVVASFAADYVAAKQSSPNPRAWLREEYERRGKPVTSSYVADMIRRATDRGFLTPARFSGDRWPRESTAKLVVWVVENRLPRAPSAPFTDDWFASLLDAETALKEQGHPAPAKELAERYCVKYATMRSYLSRGHKRLKE